MQEYPNDKEFILMIGSRVWRVYGKDEQNAKQRFLEMCREFSQTGDEHSKEQWTKLHNMVLDKKYIMNPNFDFKGAREIVG